MGHMTAIRTAASTACAKFAANCLRLCAFLGCKCIALIILVLGAVGMTYGQTLVVQSASQTVNQGDTLSINTIPNMPNLVLSVNGGTFCDRVTYIVDVTYIDQAGRLTGAEYTAQNYPGDQPVTIDWFGVLEGGNATITWQFNGNGQQNFDFFINGINPSPAAIDSNAFVGPWFARNMISAESNYLQYDVFGYPKFGPPDGIGLLQLDPAPGDEDYWAWSINEADGLTILNGKQSGAYSHWNAQINTAQLDGGPNPPALFGAYCAFQYPQNGGDFYGDADWIHAYNGFYYTLWVRPSGGSPGFWNMDGYNHSGYVQKVCNATPQ
jgi:hypothetical protein